LLGLFHPGLRAGDHCLEGGEPIDRRRFEVPVDDIQADGIEGSARFLVRENAHSEFDLGNHHDERNITGQSAGMSYDL